ncbi:hypothetical protein O7606_04385 [Micromonospora sp. WMMD882]|uniref:hypothetical protein n=1 Tax=Micromonospora sp. WMMD882 TaxID=3015151 RepID=UPI00248B4114|nr:hypothetical protein [Micromonospora sp. WMMD882]WBB80636.1 hypothetical protein O7606_04385 [Micromonospora sp. WMMD882]
MQSEMIELAELRVARARLDERELELIDRARHAGATWAQLAAALGLTSRQAAEQRRQRLVAARLTRWDQLDRAWSPQLTALRSALTELGRWMSADRAWARRFPHAALVRDTTAIAVDAAPGPLHTLATQVVADLDRVDPARLPPPAHVALAALHHALSTKH